MNLDLSGDQCVWLPNPITWPPGQATIPAEAMKLIEDPNWAAQTKEDGIHLLAARTPTRQVFLNRKGEPHAVSPTIAKALENLLPNTLLDGEKLHSGELVLFDTMYVDDTDLRELPYEARFARLNLDILPRVDRSVVRVVESAIGQVAKLELLTRIRAANGEGLVFKDLRALYRPGRPETGGTCRKLKFLKSVTCVCQRRPDTDKNQKASFEMWVMDEAGKPVNIGQVTAQQYFDDIEPGKARVGEVVYLYSTPENKLTQPVLKRPDPWRTDKSAEECTLDQLVRGGRFAVKS